MPIIVEKTRTLFSVEISRQNITASVEIQVGEKLEIFCRLKAFNRPFYEEKKKRTHLTL